MKLTQLYEASYDNIFKGNFEKAISGLENEDGFKRQAEVFVRYAKIHMKRDDRIVWVLRIYKLWKLMEIIQNANVETNAMQRGTDAELAAVKELLEKKRMRKTKIEELFAKELQKYNSKTKGRVLKTRDFNPQNLWHYFKTMSSDKMLHQFIHYLNLNVHAIDNTVFEWQHFGDILDTFKEMEESWKKNRKRLIQWTPDYHDVFLKIDDKFEWLDLGKAGCEEEGDAMGHCGNMGSTNSNETILSLREKVTIKKTIWWKPHATFIYDMSKRSLGEMKGAFNKKPDKKIHKHIEALITDKRIHKLDGGGYLPEENFSIFDLDAGTLKNVLNKKPELIEPTDYIKKYGVDGWTTKRLKALKLEVKKIDATLADQLDNNPRHTTTAKNRWYYIHKGKSSLATVVDRFSIYHPNWFTSEKQATKAAFLAYYHETHI